ncbi:HAMP domain-containing sensor histidine kinase [Tamlana crocina]
MLKTLKKYIEPNTFLSYKFTALITALTSAINVYSWFTHQTENFFTGHSINPDATMKVVTSISFIILAALYLINKEGSFKILFVSGLSLQAIQLGYTFFEISEVEILSPSSLITIVMFILIYTSLYLVKFKDRNNIFLCLNSITYIISSFAIFYYLFNKGDIFKNILGFRTLSWNTSILFFINSISIFELLLVKKISRLQLKHLPFNQSHPFYYFPLFFLGPIIVTTTVSVLTFLNFINITAGEYFIFLFLNFSIFISMFLYSFKFIDYYKDISQKSKKIEETNKRLRLLVEELNEKNLYLEDFASITSHNLREPIIALKELYSYYKDSARNNDVNIPELESMYVTNVENLNYGLNALINYHKFIGDIDNQFPNKITLSKSLENIYQELEYLKPDNTIFHSKIEADIELPKSYINNIFNNLITNSFKFKKTTDELKINISTYRARNNFYILYKDNGIGFDASLHKDEIFKKGKRFHKASKSSSGYGLYYLKLYVSRLNGQVDLFSKVNKGTIVRIKLQHE